jgi:ABC-type multidrug transport system fused ATPase/permease subunit
MNNIMVSDSLPKIELLVAKTITENVIESIKTTNATINVNEFLMNLKKVIDTKSIYHLVASYIIPTIMVAIGLLYYFFLANTKIGFIATVIVLLFVFITLYLLLYLEKDGIKDSCENENQLNLYYDNIQDVMHNIDTVIVSSTKQKEMESIEKNKSKSSFTYVKSEVESSKTTFYLHIISLITALILNGISIKMYIDKEITAKSLSIVCVITILFMRYYDSTISTLKDAISQIGKFYELENYFKQFKIYKSPGNEQFNIIDGNIVISNINVSRGD